MAIDPDVETLLGDFETRLANLEANPGTPGDTSQVETRLAALEAIKTVSLADIGTAIQTALATLTAGQTQIIDVPEG